MVGCVSFSLGGVAVAVRAAHGPVAPTMFTGPWVQASFRTGPICLRRRWRPISLHLKNPWVLRNCASGVVKSIGAGPRREAGEDVGRRNWTEVARY